MAKIIVNIPDNLLDGADGSEINFDKFVSLLATAVTKEIDHRKRLRRYNGNPPSPYDLSRGRKGFSGG